MYVICKLIYFKGKGGKDLEADVFANIVCLFSYFFIVTKSLAFCFGLLFSITIPHSLHFLIPSPFYRQNTAKSLLVI